MYNTLMHNTYIFNKRNYLNLMSQMSGGNIKTYMLTTGAYTRFSDVKLEDLIKQEDFKIKKIGSFDVGSMIVIGDTDYEKLKLRKGKYTAYTLADSLMIINDDLNINPDTHDVGKWIWKHSGKGV